MELCDYRFFTTSLDLTAPESDMEDASPVKVAYSSVWRKNKASIGPLHLSSYLFVLVRSQVGTFLASEYCPRSYRPRSLLQWHSGIKMVWNANPLLWTTTYFLLIRTYTFLNHTYMYSVQGYTYWLYVNTSGMTGESCFSRCF